MDKKNLLPNYLYKGINIIETSLIKGGIALPPLMILVAKGSHESLKQHEYGHFLQYKKLGALAFYGKVGLPSLWNCIENKWEEKKYAGIKYSVPHSYHRVETEANDLAKAHFGKHSALACWPSLSETRESCKKWYVRIFLYLRPKSFF